MEKLYHYTRESRWKTVQKKGVLYALSDPWYLTYPRSEEEILDEGFLVGVSDSEATDWRECGEFDRLKKWCTGEVVLEVPLIMENSFVRDVYMLSPKGVVERFGRDVRETLFLGGELYDHERKEYDKMWEEYYDSTKLLKDYSGDYKVLEIWMPHDTSIDKIVRKK